MRPVIQHIYEALFVYYQYLVKATRQDKTHVLNNNQYFQLHITVVKCACTSRYARTYYLKVTSIMFVVDTLVHSLLSLNSDAQLYLFYMHNKLY